MQFELGSFLGSKMELKRIDGLGLHVAGYDEKPEFTDSQGKLNVRISRYFFAALFYTCPRLGVLVCRPGYCDVFVQEKI